MGRKPMSDEDEVFLYVQAFCCSPFDLSVTAATWHDVALALNYCDGDFRADGRNSRWRSGVCTAFAAFDDAPRLLCAWRAVMV